VTPAVSIVDGVDAEGDESATVQHPLLHGGLDEVSVGLPAGVFVDNRNGIYVADSYNKRVQVFRLLEEAKND